MTAPEDPFRSPTPGSPPPGGDPAGRPVDPYGQPGPATGSPYGGQPQPGPAYGQPYGGPAFGAPRPAPRNGLGTAALVLGVLALLTGLFVVGGLLGIAAIVLGVLGRGRAKRGEATNGGMAVAGIVLGVLGLLLSALAVFGAVSLLSNSEISNLADCLQDAGNDRALQEQCRTDFEDSIGG